jgi:hypothetical protein
LGEEKPEEELMGEGYFVKITSKLFCKILRFTSDIVFTWGK